MKRTLFFCGECGHETGKWVGCCPGCGSWNTMVEAEKLEGKSTRSAAAAPATRSEVKSLAEINTCDDIRVSTGMGELDRVLGGGLVSGSLVLVGGEPGIGKSTLLLQICGVLGCGSRVLYVSGEESGAQLKLRARRLGIDTAGLLILCETDMSRVLGAALEHSPDYIIIDSIQTMSRGEIASAPGSVTQVRECTFALMQLAKGEGISIFVIGHVNKEGSIAGPKVLEHMVDCVLTFEGDRNFAYRILRATKNRFGSTNEIGVFEMSSDGLLEVPSPSEMLLSGRPFSVPGTCVACTVEGTRPILAEIQALVTSTSFGTPRRMTAGLDYNRAMLLLAVLEKRAGLYTGSCDAYINVVGGLRINEPAVDLPAALAVASSFRDKPVSDGLSAFGELGLTGELRPVPQSEQRLFELQRLGFSKCIIPERGSAKIKSPPGLEILLAKNLRDAINLAINDN